jgi:hypothetical protein
MASLSPDLAFSISFLFLSMYTLLLPYLTWTSMAQLIHYLYTLSERERDEGSIICWHFLGANDGGQPLVCVLFLKRKTVVPRRSSSHPSMWSQNSQWLIILFRVENGWWLLSLLGLDMNLIASCSWPGWTCLLTLQAVRDFFFCRVLVIGIFFLYTSDSWWKLLANVHPDASLWRYRFLLSESPTLILGLSPHYDRLCCFF